MFKSLELCFCYCAGEITELFCHDSPEAGLSAQPFGQNVLGTQKKGRTWQSTFWQGCFDRDTAGTTSWPDVQSAETTKLCQVGEAFRKPQDKAFCYWKKLDQHLRALRNFRKLIFGKMRIFYHLQGCLFFRILCTGPMCISGQNLNTTCDDGKYWISLVLFLIWFEMCLKLQQSH